MLANRNGAYRASLAMLALLAAFIFCPSIAGADTLFVLPQADPVSFVDFVGYDFTAGHFQAIGDPQDLLLPGGTHYDLVPDFGGFTLDAVIDGMGNPTSGFVSLSTNTGVPALDSQPFFISHHLLQFGEGIDPGTGVQIYQFLFENDRTDQGFTAFGVTFDATDGKANVAALGAAPLPGTFYAGFGLLGVLASCKAFARRRTPSAA